MYDIGDMAAYAYLLRSLDVGEFYLESFRMPLFPLISGMFLNHMITGIFL